MKLYKWKTNLKPKFPATIEKFFGKKITDKATDGEEISTVPSVNISSANQAFEVNMALPGLDKSDVKLEIRDNCLIISSEKQYDKEERKKEWIRKEFGYASFQRMFQIPENADHEQVLAEMKNGILSVKIAKKAEYQENKKLIAIE
jgi:HSP20 family protein